MGPQFQVHPVPQNVTNFEFHLVGDMTLKQFGYLACGLVIAFLTFVGAATDFPFVAWPIIIISSATGAAFAFLPIQERPLDHWVAAFFKAIFKPTKLVFSSKIINKDDPFFGRRLVAYLNLHKAVQIFVPAPQSGSPGAFSRKPSMVDRLNASTVPLPEDQRNQIKSDTQQLKTTNTQIPSSPQISSGPPIQPASTPLPSLEEATKAVVIDIEKEKPPEPEDLKKTVELAKEAQTTQAQIQKIEQQLEQVKAVVAKPGVDARFYVERFQALLTELQDLNKKSSETAHDLAVLSKGVEQATATVPPVQRKSPRPIEAKSIPTMSLTTFPNVINGIVTDSLGNYIEGAVIVTHDNKNLPVRALKSNKLGQFVAATPLPNGTYTMVTEKDSLVFDNVAIEISGEILKPVMISAKKQIQAGGGIA